MSKPRPCSCDGCIGKFNSECPHCLFDFCKEHFDVHRCDKYPDDASDLTIQDFKYQSNDANEKKRKFVRSSLVWQYFDWSYTREGYVVCKCKAEYNLTKTSSTSTLLAHINQRCPFNLNKPEKVVVDLNAAVTGGSSSAAEGAKLMKKRKVEHVLMPPITSEAVAAASHEHEEGNTLIVPANHNNIHSISSNKIRTTGNSSSSSAHASTSHSKSHKQTAVQTSNLKTSTSDNTKALLECLLVDINSLFDTKMSPILSRLDKLESSVAKISTNITALSVAVVMDRRQADL